MQLPQTPDSMNVINGKDFDENIESHKEIYEQLTSFYYDQFKDLECALASATTGKTISHVEELESYYVAFSHFDETVLEDSDYKDFYNHEVLFDIVSEEELERREEEKSKIVKEAINLNSYEM